MRKSLRRQGQTGEFPLHIAAQDETAALSKSNPNGKLACERLRILIVEDNQDGADSLRALLELLGHEVAVAYSGPEGVEAARTYLPEIVLCDIGLPGLDGFGVAKELRRNSATARARLIAISGYGQEDDVRRSREAGFDHHLVKPADPDELAKLLASA
jgi:two-component system CheB/CheR fusion protein